MKYRSRTEIIASMLEALASGPATKTRMMYKSYLSYQQLQQYLEYLQEKKLVIYEKETQLCRITERGLRFIHSYDEISELIAPPAFHQV